MTARHIPVGWKQLKHNRLRLAAALAGITFAAILMVVLVSLALGALASSLLSRSRVSPTVLLSLLLLAGAVTVAVVFSRMGGVAAVMGRIAEEAPSLLVREGNFSRVHWFTYSFIPLSAGMFPHMFMHWLSAKKADDSSDGWCMLMKQLFVGKLEHQLPWRQAREYLACERVRALHKPQRVAEFRQVDGHADSLARACG